jgi:tryptophan 2,3-dioxygenase
MDFLDFRDMLRPASGFQSWQFKLIEAKLGLKYEQRHGQQYYISQLRQPQIDMIKQSEKDQSVLELLNDWLERMPFFSEAANWTHYQPLAVKDSEDKYNPLPTETELPVFWADYRHIYATSLAEGEKDNLASFDRIFTSAGTRTESSLSPMASRAALFIMLYRGYPILQLPFRLLNALLDIDEQLSTWRYRHINMVHRIIGTRVGTGGSTGKEYLKGALDKHYIFKDIAVLTSFLIERRKLPKLSETMEKRLGFHS